MMQALNDRDMGEAIWTVIVSFGSFFLIVTVGLTILNIVWESIIILFNKLFWR